MAEQVCVDASLVIMLLLPHDLSAKAKALWQSWAERNTETVTAPLFFAEVTSVLRENVYFGRILVEEGEQAFATFMKFGIKSMEPLDLQPRAWALAKEYNRSRAYDAQYLAVATALGCDLWTADHRLVNAVRVPWLRWIGDHAGRSTPTQS